MAPFVCNLLVSLLIDRLGMAVYETTVRVFRIYGMHVLAYPRTTPWLWLLACTMPCLFSSRWNYLLFSLARSSDITVLWSKNERLEERQGRNKIGYKTRQEKRRWYLFNMRLKSERPWNWKCSIISDIRQRVSKSRRGGRGRSYDMKGGRVILWYSVSYRTKLLPYGSTYHVQQTGKRVSLNNSLHPLLHRTDPMMYVDAKASLATHPDWKAK